MPTHVIVTRDFDHMSEAAANIVVDDIRRTLATRDSYVLGLATGNSPTGLYKHLARAANAGAFEAGRVCSFNLDEYIGLPGENAQQRALHPESYTFFMIQELFGLLHTKFKETNVPWGTLVEQRDLEQALAASPQDYEILGTDVGKAIVIRRDPTSPFLRWLREEILDDYAAKIEHVGGIDLHVVGVGGRGHVGFHEAGIPFDCSDVCVVKLDDNTIANAVADGHFASVEESPRFAVTMTADLIFRARTVVVVANGARKTEAVTETLLMEPDCCVPLSYCHQLSGHEGKVVFVLDRTAAARALEEREVLNRRGITVEDRT
jgi:glucosamine-6-phosphate deaminase